MDRTQILCVVGPTGIGKSRVGLELAKRFGGEIVNADSRQIYREMVIGTAKPLPEEYEGIPHHLFEAASLTDVWDAARFMAEARQTIAGIRGRGRLPIVVGGTGLYVRALLFGLFEGPSADPEVRTQLKARAEREGLGVLHQELSAVDPDAALKIHPNDELRIIRALEVYELTRVPISQAQAGHRFREAAFNYLKIGLASDREELYRRIDQRVETMAAQGLEAEARDLFARFGDHPLLLRSIGYQEWRPYFEGQITREHAIREIQQNTRRFAKRQITWFRKEADVRWHAPENLEGMIEAVQRFKTPGA